MRAAGWFLLALGGTLLLAALLGWPAWQLAQALWPEAPFHRVVTRAWQLLMLAGIALCIWRLRLGSRADWGYGAPRPLWLGQFGRGLAAGLATMLPMALALTALGARSIRPELALLPLLGEIAAGALTGLAVALVEETFFRGLMYRGIERESGVAAAIALTALPYAALHFLARTPIPAAGLGWGSGLQLLAGALGNLAAPLAIADALVTLVLVGVVLGSVRHLTGTIAAGAGLHMGWVWVIQATLDATARAPAARSAWLVSSYDGFTGWLVAGWGALLLAALWRWRAPLTRWLAPPR